MLTKPCRSVFIQFGLWIVILRGLTARSRDKIEHAMSLGAVPDDGEALIGEIARALVNNPFWDFWRD